MYPLENLFILFGSISFALSSLVVLTGLVFTSMLQSRNIFSYCLFFISLCDMVGSIVYILGFPRNGTIVCEFQAFLFVFVVPSSWLWTAALVFQLRCAVIYKRIWLSATSLHLIVWGLNLLLTLLPLSTNAYGQDDAVIDTTCDFRGNKRFKDVWLVGGLFGRLILALAIMVFCMVSVAYHFSKISETIPRRNIALYRSMSLYPLGMVLVWTPALMAQLLMALGFYVPPLTFEAFEVLNTQYGTILTLIFFTRSHSYRDRWVRLFRRKCGFVAGDLIEENSIDDALSVESSVCGEEPQTLITVFRNSSASLFRFTKSSAGQRSSMTQPLKDSWKDFDIALIQSK